MPYNGQAIKTAGRLGTAQWVVPAKSLRGPGLSSGTTLPW